MEYKIELYYCPHWLFNGWHLYANGEHVKRGTALAYDVVQAFGEQYPYLPVSQEIQWFDAFVKRIVSKYPTQAQEQEDGQETAS